MNRSLASFLIRQTDAPWLAFKHGRFHASPTVPVAEPLACSTYRLLLPQVRQCGITYVCRKFLAIALFGQHKVHQEVSRALALPRVNALIDHYPRSTFKYLHKYLARSFQPSERALALSHHYRYLNERINSAFIPRICRETIVLWQCVAEGFKYEIGLSYPKNEEGELFLSFRENGTAIFTLAFTIVPGCMFKLTNGPVIFIGRFQGVASQKVAIKRAGSLCHEVVPATLLLDTVRAIARTLSIPGIVGVSAANQVCLRDHHRAGATAIYDEFWLAAGASQIGNIGYHMPTVKEDTPLSEIKNKYRSRTKRKRAFRGQLAEEVTRSFVTQCLAPSAHRVQNGALATMEPFSPSTSPSLRSATANSRLACLENRATKFGLPAE